MTEQARKYLSDIQVAIELVETFLEETRSFPSFQMDMKTKSAVERQLEILGEALNKYSREAPESPLSDVPRIVSFRNRLDHNYDQVDDTITWAILKKHLPNLKMEVLNFLSGPPSARP